MIDIEAARQIALHWAPGCANDIQTDVVLADEKTEEYEWGWVFYLRARDPSLVPPSRAHLATFPSAFLVDRVTGATIPRKSSGMVISVDRLLELRQLRLDEMRGSV